jgi:hypothetical protein
MIWPPMDNIPRALRGKTVEVTFYLDAAGIVTDLSITPPIADRKYAKQVDEALRDYRFRPARDADGRAVASVSVFQLNFPET